MPYPRYSFLYERGKYLSFEGGGKYQYITASSCPLPKCLLKNLIANTQTKAQIIPKPKASSTIPSKKGPTVKTNSPLVQNKIFKGLSRKLKIKCFALSKAKLFKSKQPNRRPTQNQKTVLMLKFLHLCRMASNSDASAKKLSPPQPMLP